MTLYTLLHL